MFITAGNPEITIQLCCKGRPRYSEASEVCSALEDSSPMIGRRKSGRFSPEASQMQAVSFIFVQMQPNLERSLSRYLGRQKEDNSKSLQQVHDDSVSCSKSLGQASQVVDNKAYGELDRLSAPRQANFCFTTFLKDVQ